MLTSTSLLAMAHMVMMGASTANSTGRRISEFGCWSGVHDNNHIISTVSFSLRHLKRNKYNEIMHVVK